MMAAALLQLGRYWRWSTLAPRPLIRELVMGRRTPRPPTQPAAVWYQASEYGEFISAL
jgi:hypothetical protein